MAPLRKKSSEKRSGFSYTPRDPDKVKERAEQTGSRFDSPFEDRFDTFRPKVGDNLIRILPPTWDDHDHYGFDIWVHSYIGPDNGTYLCLNKMQNKPCPICKAQRESAAAGETEEAKVLAHAKKTVAWIIDRDEETPTPKLYVMSWTMDRDIAALCHNKRTGKVLLIDHPDEGYDITIKRAGQGLKTRYFGMAVDRDPSPIADEQKQQDEILDFIQENPIPSVLKYKDATYLERVIEGTAEAEEETEDSAGAVEENDRRSSRRRGREEEDEEVEEETPPRRSTRGRQASVDNDEDAEPKPRHRGPRRDEETDEDREEEPTPRKSSRRVVDDEEEENPLPDEDESPRRRRPARDEEEEEDEPKSSRRSSRERVSTRSSRR